MKEANAAEPLRFWGGGEVQGRCVLGAAVRQACPTADDLGEALSAYAGEAFAVTYRRALSRCVRLHCAMCSGSWLKGARQVDNAGHVHDVTLVP